MVDILLDTVIDGIKLLPFLFITYLAMEYLEHRTSNKTKEMIKRSGKFGPFAGGVLGVVPQCGFSAAASNLYAGRVITLGTLISIYLSTSDEMLPILISQQADIRLIFSVLGGKIVIGMIAGFIIDFVLRKRKNQNNIDETIAHMCEHEHCHCEKSIFKSALKHTLVIMVYIVLISLALNVIISLIGQENLAGLILNRPVVGSLISAVVGLIPNCASSVVITQLYLDGILSVGAMMSGLLAGSGVGILVLFRVNDDNRENLKIVGILYCIGVVSGILIDFAAQML